MVHVPHSYYFTMCNCDCMLVWYSPTFTVLSNGALRLVNTGSTQFGGRLEVYYNSKWGTVCNDGWDLPDATVACRQMGFGGVSDSDSSRFHDGMSSQSRWLNEMACSGLESRLIDCSHAGIESNNCSHSEDVGVVCTTGELGWNTSNIGY